MKHRFTFPELVIISGISLLAAALLIPTLGAAGKKARTLACTEKQQNLYKGFAAYCSDNDNLLPDGAQLDRRSKDGWWNKLYPYTRDNHLSRCPDAADPDNGPAIITFYTGPEGKYLKYAKASIAYNSQLGAGNNGGTVSSSGHGLGYPKQIKKVTDLNKPPLLFADITAQVSILPGDNRQDQLNGSSPAAPGTFAARHLGKGNIIFTDGHAEALSGPELWQKAETAYNASAKRTGTAFPVMNYFLTGQ
ncbi:MAG: hypothetical protein E7058_02545 [Lentisphaerae bacterium]|nr:hypothetical protein [Lentisphaerota bacterium]